MTSKEIFQLASTLGLGPKEIAHLVGISVKTIRRGVRKNGTVDVILRSLQEKLADPKTHLSIRALAIVSARGEGLKMLIARLAQAYVTMDSFGPR